MNLDKTELQYLLNNVSRRLDEAQQALILEPRDDLQTAKEWLTELHKKLQREYYKQDRR